MRYLSLVIKGNRFRAANEAADRKLPLVFRRELRSTPAILTVGITATDFLPGVIAWFAETNNDGPWPEGSLLCYTVHNEPDRHGDVPIVDQLETKACAACRELPQFSASSNLCWQCYRYGPKLY